MSEPAVDNHSGAKTGHVLMSMAKGALKGLMIGAGLAILSYGFIGILAETTSVTGIVNGVVKFFAGFGGEAAKAGAWQIPTMASSILSSPAFLIAGAVGALSGLFNGLGTTSKIDAEQEALQARRNSQMQMAQILEQRQQMLSAGGGMMPVASQGQLPTMQQGAGYSPAMGG